MCGDSHWRAAANKSKRNCKLDETGLEYAGCRHGLALWAVNLYRGELYGYPHYLHVNCMVPARVKYVWQDVICKYWPWAEKVNLPADMKPALSVMHAKAHNWNCQVSDNPMTVIFVAGCCNQAGQSRQLHKKVNGSLDSNTTHFLKHCQDLSAMKCRCCSWEKGQYLLVRNHLL